MTTLNLPTKMEFSMGSTEQKMDMTLDDIIRLGRKSNQKRIPIKNQNRRNFSGNNAAAKAALQRSVAARSAKIRQGRLAEARIRNGAGKLAATQAAAKMAFGAPIRTRTKPWIKNRPLAGHGPKPTSYTAAAGNMKISVINNGSKFGGQRQPGASFRRRNVPTNSVRQVQTMDVDGYGQQSQAPRQRARTLDALFAEINERRSQPQVIQPFSVSDRGSNRRNGRGAFGGRGRGRGGL